MPTKHKDLTNQHAFEDLTRRHEDFNDQYSNLTSEVDISHHAFLKKPCFTNIGPFDSDIGHNHYILFLTNVIKG